MLVIFLAIFGGLKLSSICCKSEKFRSIKTALRPIMNGLVISLLPQLCTFAGFHLRMLNGSNSAINGIGSISILIGLVLYFILLLCQIRGIISKI